MSSNAFSVVENDSLTDVLGLKEPDIQVQDILALPSLTTNSLLELQSQFSASRQMTALLSTTTQF